MHLVNYAQALTQNVHQINTQLAQLPLEALARQTGFRRRTPRKAPLPQFLLGLLALAAETCLVLERAAALIGLAAHTTYSKQALHKRLSARLEAFVAQVAIRLLGQLTRTPTLQSHLLPFTRVLLHDSTSQKLPPALAATFPGSANQYSATQAALKVQFIGDLRAATLLHLSLSGFTRNDQAAAPDILHVVRPGDLVLRDLGYFVLHCFQHLIQRGAFFLSRYRHGTVLLDPQTRQPLDLPRRLRQTGQLDRPVLLGQQHQIPVRLVALPVPEALANERRRKARLNRDRRLRPSAQRLYLLGWNLFVTNVDSTLWPPKALVTIYRLRWRIEVVFKAWKSHLGWRHLNTRSAALLRLSAIVKLLFCVLVYRACDHLECLGQGIRHVSLLRLASLCAHHASLLVASLLGITPERLLAHQLTHHAFYERRPDRTNFYQLLAGQTSP